MIVDGDASEGIYVKWAFPGNCFKTSPDDVLNDIASRITEENKKKLWITLIMCFLIFPTSDTGNHHDHIYL